jgi:hypothetical protein
MNVGKRMRSSKGLFGQRGSRKLHPAPVIKDLKGKINAYFETNNTAILSEILWDTILIQDYPAFLSRAQEIMQILAGIREFYNKAIDTDSYFADFYLQINENIDYFAHANKDHSVRAEARKRNYELLSRTTKQGWEYYHEKYLYCYALFYVYRGQSKRLNPYVQQALECVEKIDEMGMFPYWCMLTKFKLQSQETATRSAFVSNMDIEHLTLNVMSGLYNEKACLMMNRIISNDIALEMEREANRQWVFRRWFDIYSTIVESGRMPSGINRKVYDIIIHYAGQTPEMSIDEQISLHESMYSMKKELGYYQTGKFSDRLNMATPEDPFEYIKDLYYIRGFSKEMKLIGKDLTMRMKDIRIRACKVDSVEDVKRRLDAYKGTVNLFYYFAFDTELDNVTVTSILNMFCEREREINWPATFRLVHKNASGHFICPESFNGMI